VRERTPSQLSAQWGKRKEPAGGILGEEGIVLREKTRTFDTKGWFLCWQKRGKGNFGGPLKIVINFSGIGRKKKTTASCIALRRCKNGGSSWKEKNLT